MMRRRLIEAAVVAAAFAMPAQVDAHRLDEYLQATRVSIDADRIAVEIDLSPGVSVADAIIGTIDTDGDGLIRDREADAYAARVLRDVNLSVDGRPVALRLDHRVFPTIADMRLGAGTIRLAASAPVEPAAGRRRLVYTNAFLPDASVYLVNALVPSDRRIRIGSQYRDQLQRTFTLDYEVTSSRAWLAWSGLGLAMMAILVAGRTRSPK